VGARARSRGGAGSSNGVRGGQLPCCDPGKLRAGGTWVAGYEVALLLCCFAVFTGCDRLGVACEGACLVLAPHV
jgi:hypothetical protein